MKTMIKITTDDRQQIDEVFAKNGQLAVHLERMDGDRLCLIIETEAQQAILNLVAYGDLIKIVMQEITPKESA